MQKLNFLHFFIYKLEILFTKNKLLIIISKAKYNFCLFNIYFNFAKLLNERRNNMKKIIYVLTLVTLLIIPFKTKAKEMDSYVNWNLDRSVFAHQYRNETDHITNLAMLKANDKTAYCIEPGITADKDSWYNSTTNINETNIRPTNLKRLSLIGYYGYGYGNHTTKEYYMATQELIWRLMGVENVWWTDSKYGGNKIDIERYKHDILSLVDKYEVVPSFDFKDKYIVGDYVVLEDKNNVLEEYETNSSNVKLSGNKISIKITGINNSFTLYRKKNNKSPIFYYKNGFQTIGTFEYAYDFSSDYNVNGEYGKIIVNKVDKDKKDNKPSSIYASLKDASYTLYDKNGNKIETKKTDENGIIIFDNLVKGNYFISETKPSLGYTLDDKRYEVYVATSNLEVTIDSYENIIKNEVIIHKVLEEYKTKKQIDEENIEFALYYENGDFINSYVTDSKGLIKLTLPYGKYILKQITTKNGITTASDRKIEVLKDKEVKEIKIINYELKPSLELPNTGKSFNPFILFATILSLGVIVYIYEKKNY